MFAHLRRIPVVGGTVAGWLGCRVSLVETARDVVVTIERRCVTVGIVRPTTVRLSQ